MSATLKSDWNLVYTTALRPRAQRERGNPRQPSQPQVASCSAASARATASASFLEPVSRYNASMPRPFQFNLRTLLWAVGLTAVVCLIGPPIAAEFRGYPVEFEPPNPVDPYDIRNFHEFERLLNERPERQRANRKQLTIRATVAAAGIGMSRLGILPAGENRVPNHETRVSNGTD